MTTASGVDVLTAVMIVMVGMLGGFVGYRITRGKPRTKPYEPTVWLDGIAEARRVAYEKHHKEWIKTHPQQWEEII